MTWVNVDERLPNFNRETNWRTAKAFPVHSTEVGLTYAYLTRNGWVESHRFGDEDANMAPTDGSDELIMADVVQWYDIAEPGNVTTK